MLHTKHFPESHLLFALAVGKFYFYHTKRWRHRDGSFPLFYFDTANWKRCFFSVTIKCCWVVEAVQLPVFLSFSGNPKMKHCYNTHRNGKLSDAFWLVETLLTKPFRRIHKSEFPPRIIKRKQVGRVGEMLLLKWRRMLPLASVVIQTNLPNNKIYGNMLRIRSSSRTK